MIAKRSSRVMALLLALPSTALALGLGNIQLKSHLDQPLDARIAVLGATPGALQSLSVGLASRATFAQYGLTWPAYLDGAHVKVTKGANGQVLLHLTSPHPVTDPILTLLVKASWDRGVLYREYTILLNPPTYVPSASQPHHVAVAAPAVGTAARSGELTHPSAAPSVAPAVAAPATPPASASSGPSRVHVHRGDTLSGIASRFGGGGMDSTRTRQWMVAIYQLNPRAFDHNMNLLRAGTVLQIPSSTAVSSVSGRSAWREVNRQDSLWRASAPPPAANNGSGRLRLVAPGSGSAAQGGRGASAGAVSALRSQVRTLKGELANEKRLLQVKNAALARLQRQVAGAHAAPQRPGAAPAAAATHRAVSPAPRRPVRRVTPPPRAAASSGLIHTLKQYWWAGVALLALLIAYALARVLRSRRESAANDLLSESAEPVELGFAARVPPVPEERMSPAPRPEDAIDVRESTHEQPQPAMPEDVSPLVARHVPADQTMSSETALNLEQGDPLAEADFHMAYGLYDQAADLIRIAIQREPDRRDLKLKLLEVFFVWGNKEQFVETAHELAETRDEASSGEWDKVVIMGRQLAPEDPLFATSEVSGAASQGVDLDLEGGQSRVDFDLMSGAIPAGRTGESEGGAGGATSSSGSFDLDIGAALGEDEAAAHGSASDLSATLPGLETTGADNGVTQEMPQETAEYPQGQTGTYEPVEPTVEQPALNTGQSALRQKVEALSQGSERTAELAIDDLGLDLGTFETSVQPSLGTDVPTMVAGLDEKSRDLLDKAHVDTAAPGEASDEPPSSTATTSAWQINERDLENLLAAEPRAGAPDTAQTSRLSTLKAPEVDYDLGAQRTSKQTNGNGVDFDIGTATVPHAEIGAAEGTADDAASELEPVTAGEVGTKLDLARAYMDMGDPEGARSILEEVMHEGSDAQRQEAGRLLESLPG